jgi:hypothetical protein
VVRKEFDPARIGCSGFCRPALCSSGSSRPVRIGPRSSIRSADSLLDPLGRPAARGYLARPLDRSIRSPGRWKSRLEVLVRIESICRWKFSIPLLFARIEPICCSSVS